MESAAEHRHHPAPSSPVKPPRKRKRIVISCTECHRRKQKCDRQNPCSNCVARNKQGLCRYESESARKQQLLDESANGSAEEGALFHHAQQESETAAQVSAFGYAKSSGTTNTALGIFKKIENLDADPSSRLPNMASSSSEYGGLREKYKSMIRQLPAKPYIEQLVACFFREVNWQYCPLDEGPFRDLLKNWHSLSFSTLNKGPQELPPDLQFFPALLFQTLAMALQFQPIDYDQSLDSLKYAAGMSLDDLASDYSESGCQILCMLGKRHTTLVTVQAGFLRTAYLKNCGLVPESWHHLSSTIRDAQEIGLHKPDMAQHQRKPEEKPEDYLEHLWLEQLRHRMWLILSLWDIHMAIVLGRPTVVSTRDGKPAFPIDAPIPKNRREVAPAQRTDADPPTPLTMLLWNAEIAAPLWDIFSLEKEDPNQNNYSKLELMHKKINTITHYCPPYFRAQNPDTTFDSHPDCFWLPCARATFQTSTAFTVMALHRPYIFTNANSRTAALRAGLDILRAQRTYFNLLSIRHYKMFSLVLNTFDAIVLVAAIYILHPAENPDELDDALQHFRWGMDRFETMSERNSMAKTALSVLKAICVRLRKAMNRPVCQPRVETDMSQVDPQLKVDVPPTSGTPTLPSPEPGAGFYTPRCPNPPAPRHPSISSASAAASNSEAPQSASTAHTQYTLPTISNLTESAVRPRSMPASAATVPPATSPWYTFSVPQTFDFSSMAPLQPMRDLLFNDLGGTIDGGLDLNNPVGMPTPGIPGWNAGASGGANGMSSGGADPQWQFEGDFANDSFWGFMNTYHP
ncbi:fungal specific transcription factor domain-containing protein [Drepanopeziza brunnea f. sp. 'multigermtubi' MB_m1]|uniref:Fungal specific transcription factor domain-containing protein n=1 Tax=Marssonina brunnea f. sp. multigermtubi (strain MB_m1) TaxID=1072389 RepID=K1XF90_MARBU|nr:fungal specific transcription factor domain-containing protein [Drepanopeziza brunnea f. sp. 'multigermtubi' MB_m1]EKD19533.1 fungal specific transcription factor domain-containing protein [Drepanopeziza brunnea f. sp. 'multigermtubi' MB_m1]